MSIVLISLVIVAKAAKKKDFNPISQEFAFEARSGSQVGKDCHKAKQTFLGKQKEIWGTRPL